MRKYLFVLSLLCLPSIATADWGKQLVNSVESSDYYQLLKQKLITANFEKEAYSQSFYNPEIQVDYKNSEVNEFSIGISRSIDFSNKRQFSKNYGQMRLLSAQANAKEIERQLLFQAINALVELRKQQQLEQLNLQQKQLLSQLAKDIREKERIGELGKLDSQVSEIAMANFLSQTSKQLLDLNSAKEQANIWFSNSESLPKSLPKALTAKIRTPFFEKLIEQTPQILLSLSQVNLLKADWKRTVALNKSDPTVGINVGKEGDANTVGVTFSMPLNISNDYSSANSAKHSEFLEQDYQLAITRKLMELEFKKEFSAYTQLFDSYQDWKTIASVSIKGNEKLLVNLWKEGEITTSEFIVANQQRLNALKSGIELQNNLYKQYIQWLSTSNQLRSWLMNQ
ncbi:MAG: TolC family protein [Gammaproteobacteria bacterium]|nr:TolC family protein [Gammaproteobacteria bacterium]